MSKYEELGKLASKYSAETFSIKDECQRFSGRLALGYVQHLGVPQGRYSFAELSSELAVIKRNCGFGSHPEVVRGDDGFWYFGLYIRLQEESSLAYLDQIWKIGISRNKSGYIVRLDDCDTEIAEDHHLKDLYEAMYKSDIDELNKPINSPRKRIGF